MIPRSLAEIARVVHGRLDEVADPSITANDVVTDSRAVTNGALFAALRGESTDGHEYVAAAIGNGASAALVTHPVNGPAIVVDDVVTALARLAAHHRATLDQLTVVGITGSTGKTTTKDLTAAVLSSAAPTVAAPASYNNEIGLPLAVIQAHRDTRYLVLEYSARRIGHIAYLTTIVRPDIAVVLNVGTAHVGEFGGRDNIAKAKGELLEALAPDGVAILNTDDPRVIAMTERAPDRRVIGYGSHGEISAHQITLDQQCRARFTLQTPRGNHDVQLRYVGSHQVENALAAAAVGFALELAPSDLADALSAAEPVSRLRMEVRPLGNRVLLINDTYNANPDSMRSALHTLAHLAAANSASHRTWAVLGQMLELGDYADEAHLAVGKLAADLGIDRILTIDADRIAAGVKAAGRQPESFPSLETAISFLNDELCPGDIILVKGSRAVGLERVARAVEDHARDRE
jgi:UDP-N-acetylmuramoyl-tripeptide--D-alanyl-D-alanine ligase